MRRRLVQLLLFQLVRHADLCQPNKCSTSTCYILPPSPVMYPPSYQMVPLYPMAPSAIPPPPPPPPAPMPPRHSSMMIAPQTPFVSPLDPPLPSLPVSSSANTYETMAPPSPVMTRWDRQEAEYKHVDEPELVVAPDIVVADVVDEKSTSSEKVHENERLARMDVKFEEPEPIPFDNGTVTFHAWFF